MLRSHLFRSKLCISSLSVHETAVFSFIFVDLNELDSFLTIFCKPLVRKKAHVKDTIKKVVFWLMCKAPWIWMDYKGA